MIKHLEIYSTEPPQLAAPLLSQTQRNNHQTQGHGLQRFELPSWRVALERHPQEFERRTPQQRRATYTVDCILEAALLIISEEGLAELTTNAIADRAGVSIGSLYQYFPNKDAVISALILLQHIGMATCIETAIERTNQTNLWDAVHIIHDTAVFGKPDLHRLRVVLDSEEDRLPKTSAIKLEEQRMQKLLHTFFGRYFRDEIPHRMQSKLINDIVGIVFAFTGQDHQEFRKADGNDLSEFRMRLHAAVFSYVSHFSATTLLDEVSPVSIYGT